MNVPQGNRFLPPVAVSAQTLTPPAPPPPAGTKATPAAAEVAAKDEAVELSPSVGAGTNSTNLFRSAIAPDNYNLDSVSAVSGPSMASGSFRWASAPAIAVG